MIFTAAIIALLFFAPAGASVEPPAVRRALVAAFGGDTTLVVSSRSFALGAEDRAAISRAAGGRFPADTLRLWICRRGGATAGYGIVDDVRGKSRNITYLVALDTSGAVAAVDILVYRESHGGEVASSAFRDQFVGKRTGDQLAPGRDIRIISGATISSRSVTAGVKKLLAAFDRVKERIRAAEGGGR